MQEDNLSVLSIDAQGDRVRVSVVLPSSVSSVSDIDAEIAGSKNDELRIQLAALLSADPLCVALPFPIDPESARVRCKKSQGQRRVLTFDAVRAAVAAHGDAGGPPADLPPPAAATGADASVSNGAHAPPASSAGAAAAEQAPAGVGASAALAEAVGPPQPAPAPPPHERDAQAGASYAPGAASAPDCDRAGAASAPRSRSPSSSASSCSSPAPPPRSPGGDSADDAALYADFYCNSPPAVRAPPACSSTNGGGAPPATVRHPPTPAAAATHPAGAAAPPAPAATTSSAAAAENGTASAAAGNGTAPAAAAAALPAATSAANAAKVAAAFAPTGGTSSRPDGFTLAAPHVPPPPPLPPGLPPIAPHIDCRYLAVANALRVSAHGPTAEVAELLGLAAARRPSAAAAARTAARAEEIVARVAATLDAYGYAVLDDFISEASVRAARAELGVMEPHFSPGLIWVGKEAEAGAQIAVSGVRGDVVLWLDDQALGATAFVKGGVRRPCSFMQLQQLLADLDELVFERLRRRLPYLAGLHRRSDAMLAIYPGKGARFAKHVDNTTTDGRRLTVLTYLNPGWQEQQGGALRLFPVRQGAAPEVDVLPLCGRVALFLSAEVAHEVMPAYGSRWAGTLWYYDAGEHAGALAMAKALPGASSRPSAQAGAQALLRDLLADEAGAGIAATAEGCRALALRLASLEKGARQLIAAVVGAPSPDALMESWQNLTPARLHGLRESLRNMGLDAQHHAPNTSGHASV